MAKVFNAMPFTTLLNYSVEEISMEEFMAAVNQSSLIKSERLHMSTIKAKVSGLKAA